MRRRTRTQRGQIVQFSGRWFVRYWQRQMVKGSLVRKRVAHSLGLVQTRGKRPPDEIVKAADAHMRTINDNRIEAEHTLTLAEFVKTVYLPWIKEHKRPSTYKGYRDLWECHLAALFVRGHRKATKNVRTLDKLMKDVRTFDCQNWLNQIGEEDLSRNSLKHAKSVLSGMFTLAKRLGYFDGANPVEGTAVNPSAREPEDTYAYSLEQVQLMLSVLPEPASTVFAVAAFAGLRESELQGLEWSDYHDGALWVSRSVWKGQVGEPKTRGSKAPVLVIRQLKERLDRHRFLQGSPSSGPVFANSVGGRLNLNNLRGRVILPALNRCKNCKKSEAEHRAHPARFNHKYERDARYPEWHGWHAGRRGLASNLNALGVDDSIIQRILRHSSVTVTQSYYIKTFGDDVREAMGKIEQNFDAKSATQELRDSNGTVNREAGAKPASVN